MLQHLPKRFNKLFDGINGIFVFIFGEPELEIPKKKNHIDIDVYDENGDYDPEKIDAIDERKAISAYDNGIAMMQEINDGMKVITTRTTLLLGYLSAVVATLAPLLIQGFFEGVVVLYFSRVNSISCAHICCCVSINESQLNDFLTYRTKNDYD